MHVLKRILSVFCLLVLVLGFSTAPASAEETVFETSRQLGYLTGGEWVDCGYDNERLAFDRDADGVLRLMSRENGLPYLTFKGYDGGPADYTINELRTSAPAMKFFEIIATKGPKHHNNGYWLVSKQDNEWMVFMTVDSLATMGYNPRTNNTLVSAVNANGNGKLIVTCKPDIPPAAIPAGADKDGTLRLNLAWEPSVRWFSVQLWEPAATPGLDPGSAAPASSPAASVSNAPAAPAPAMVNRAPAATRGNAGPVMRIEENAAGNGSVLTATIPRYKFFPMEYLLLIPKS